MQVLPFVLPTGPAIPLSQDPFESFSLFFKPDFMKIIVDETNNFTMKNRCYLYCVHTTEHSCYNRARHGPVRHGTVRYGTARLKLPCEQAQNRAVPYRAGTVIATVLHSTVRRGSITFVPCEQITALSMHIIS